MSIWWDGLKNFVSTVNNTYKMIMVERGKKNVPKFRDVIYERGLTIFSVDCDIHSVPDLDVHIVRSVFLLLADQSICNKRFVSFVIIVYNGSIDVFVAVRIGSGNGLSDGIRLRTRRCRGSGKGMCT